MKDRKAKKFWKRQSNKKGRKNSYHLVKKGNQYRKMYEYKWKLN